MWSALARHAGSAGLVDAHVRRTPALRAPALASTLRPGLAHLARPLIRLTFDPAFDRAGGGGAAGGGVAGGASSEACGRVVSALLAPRVGRPSAWTELALDDGELTLTPNPSPRPGASPQP